MGAPQLNLRYLEIFFQVVRDGSITQAARSLGLTQPTVSGHIQQLEKDTGVDLLDRSHGRARPTDVGKVLFSYAQAIHEQKVRAEGALADALGLRTGILRVGGSTTPATYFLPAALCAFGKAHPGVDVELRTGTTREVLDALDDDLIDLAVVGSGVEGGRYEVAEVYRDRVSLFVGPEHPWTEVEEISVSELADSAWLMRPRGSATRMVIEQELESQGVDTNALRVQLTLPTHEAIREALSGGTAAAFLPDTCTAGRHPPLRRIEVVGLSVERPVSAVWASGGVQKPVLEAFRSLLLKEAQNLSS